MGFLGTGLLAGLVSALILAGCGGDSATYTLYRNSVIEANLRIHVATFDAAESEGYNRENCEQARIYFRSSLGLG